MKLPYDTLLFDLDGTIIDSAPGVFASLRPAFAAVGLPEPSEALLRRFIGPPLAESFETYCHLDGEKISEAIRVFRSHYEVDGKLLCSAYPGLERLFARLKQAGKRLFVATSKSEVFAREIMANLGLASYFDGIYGADLSERVEKWEVLARLIMENTGIDREHAVMIGDRKYDVVGAARCGLDCIGILYGFGDRTEFEAAGAKYITETVESLEELLLPPQWRKSI